MMAVPTPEAPIADLAALQARIGHVFADQSLLVRALTHVSALPAAQAQRRVDSYQRLEFLGDRVLGLAVSTMLYETFPLAEEGELSRRLADLVRKDTCADVARDWGVGPLVRLGEGEAQTGGAKKSAILGDICESILGAIFLDAGYPAAESAVRQFFAAKMRNPGRPLRDPKTALQEWAQARKLDLPRYVEISAIGPDHAPNFTSEVRIDGLAPARGEGPSKRAAEQSAASAMLLREGVWLQPAQDY